MGGRGGQRLRRVPDWEKVEMMTTRGWWKAGGDSVGGLRKGVVRDGRGVSTSSSLLLGFSLKLRSWATNSNVPGPDVDDAASL